MRFLKIFVRATLFYPSQLFNTPIIPYGDTVCQGKIAHFDKLSKLFFRRGATLGVVDRLANYVYSTF